MNATTTAVPRIVYSSSTNKFMFLYMCCSVLNIMNASQMHLNESQFSISCLACYILQHRTITRAAVLIQTDTRFTSLDSRLPDSVILLLHKPSVNKKFILCSYNSHFVRFCSSELRSKAERVGDSFRSNESMTQMTRS